jgi:hypothetical protein
MEAVFQPETYRTRNRSFPNLSRHRNIIGTYQFPAGNSLERRRIHQETDGNHTYTIFLRFFSDFSGFLSQPDDFSWIFPGFFRIF